MRRARIPAAVAVAALGIALLPAAGHAAGPTSGYGLEGGVDVVSGACSVLDDPSVTTDDGYGETEPFSTSAGSRSGSTVQKVVADADPADVVTGSASSALSVAATSGTAGLGSVDTVVSAQASQSSSKGAASICDVNSAAAAMVTWVGTITQPGWLAVTATSQASGPAPVTEGYIAFTGDLSQSQPDAGFTHLAVGRSTGTTTVWVPRAGAVAIQTQLTIETTREQPSASGTLSLHATFTPAGAAIGAASGKTKYAALPQALNCGTHTATVGLAKTAKKAKSVKVLVNGKVVSTSRAPGAHTLAVPAAGPVTVSVTATPKVKKSKHAKPGKKAKKAKPVTVTRAYAACS